MRILPVNNDNQKLSSIQFKRKPRPLEYKYYVPTIKEGLNALNKELGFIIHNQSVPSNPKVNLGIGSLLSKNSKELFLPFLVGHGFSSVQQEPNYIRRVSDPSPYDPLSTSKNIYMIPLEKLATEEYGFLVKPKELEKIYTLTDERVNYKSVNRNYEKILSIAYNNLNSLAYNNQTISKLAKEFVDFRAKNKTELEKNAIYEVLTKIHGEEDWRKWPEEDKYLFDKPDNKTRVEELLRNNIKQIDFYIFKQWLVEREIEKTNKYNAELGIKIMADIPVAFAPTEEWLNKDLFIDGLAMGCQPDGNNALGQRWGFPVINPNKIFNKDGSLGEAGKFLKKRYESIFKASPGGARIDHLIGLIDPFVYVKNDPKMTSENSGRLCTSPHMELFKNYGRYTESDFTAIFEKIIFPVAKKCGVPKSNIICEDIGNQTEPVKNVIKKLGLTCLTLTQYGQTGYDSPPNNVIMLGAHDNMSYIEYTDMLFNRASYNGNGLGEFNYKTHILGSDTVTPGKDVNLYREEIRSSKQNFMAASFAELFTAKAKKVQIFFTDFFGIGKTYNIPGTKKDCWTLRLNSNYEDLYYENLKNGTAVNLPQAIATAIRQKGVEFSSQHTKLLRKLDYFTKIFKD